MLRNTGVSNIRAVPQRSDPRFPELCICTRNANENARNANTRCSPARKHAMKWEVAFFTPKMSGVRPSHRPPNCSQTGCTQRSLALASADVLQLQKAHPSLAWTSLAVAILRLASEVACLLGVTCSCGGGIFQRAVSPEARFKSCSYWIMRPRPLRPMLQAHRSAYLLERTSNI